MSRISRLRRSTCTEVSLVWCIHRARPVPGRSDRGEGDSHQRGTIRTVAANPKKLTAIERLKEEAAKQGVEVKELPARKGSGV